METSKLIESESTTVSAPLKRQGNDDNTSIETKKPKITRELPISDLQDVIDTHKYSLQHKPDFFLDRCGSDWWEFQPEEHYLYKRHVRYTVRRKMKGKCGWGWRCNYYCPKCKKCSHQLECDCEGGKGGNTCEHVHFVGRLLKIQDGEEDQDDEEDDEEESEGEEGDEENENEEDEEEDDSTEEIDEDQESEDEEDNYETDQRNASSITSEVEVLLKKARTFVTGKKNADILIQNLKSTFALLEQNKK